MITKQIRNILSIVAAVLISAAPIMAQESHIEYWFDNDRSTLTTSSISGGHVTLDVSQLDEGYHLLHIVAVDSIASAPMTVPFARIVPPGDDRYTVTCYVDDVLKSTRTITLPDEMVKLDMVVDEPETNGMHKVELRLIVPDGSIKSYVKTFYTQGLTLKQRKEFNTYYSIDGGSLVKIDDEPNLDEPNRYALVVNNLTAGEHDLTMVLSNGSNLTVISDSETFWKVDLFGDVNFDGAVNSGDVSLLFDSIVTNDDGAIYDINGDGVINAADVSALYNIILLQ